MELFKMNIKNEKKISILVVINSLAGGGAPSLLKNFILESKEYKTVQIEVATLYSVPIFKDDLLKAGFKVWDFNLKYKYDIRVIFRLINLIKKRKYDIVHVHLFPSNIFVAVASLFLPSNIMLLFI